MPKVGKMRFPYTEQGMRDAQNYAKETGKPMEMEGGGMMPKYGHGGMVGMPKRPMMPMRRGGGRTMNPLMARALAGQMAKMKKGGKVNKPKMTNKLKAELMMEGLKKYKGKKRKGAKK